MSETQLAVKPAKIEVSTAMPRFNAGYIVNDRNGCWEWRRAKNPAGYGMFWFMGSMVLAHRFSFEAASGKPLGDACALHHCDNPQCVNPSHLFAGTRHDNRQDAIKKGRNLPKGIGERSAKAKLRDADIPAIRKMRSSGLTYRAIAAKFSVYHSAIIKVCKFTSWKHIPQNN